MSDRDAAAFRIGFSTAWIGLVRRGALRAGEWLLVLGAAGGSGSAAVQLGRALGARVVAVDGGDQRLAFCERLGAEVVVYRAAGSLADAVLAATDGRGVDVVYDHDALLALAADGHLAGTATAVPFDRLPDAVEEVPAASPIGKLVVQIREPA